MPELAVRRLDPDLPLPASARPGDAGLDPVARDDVVVPAHGGRAVVATGIAVIVDDNQTNLKILTLHLQGWGMSTCETTSPLEALKWIKEGEAFDVAILDMQMPEMDGASLGFEIRKQRSASDLPLVLFTSLGRHEAEAEAVGFSAYLSKPIKPSQLFDALVGTLGHQPELVKKETAEKPRLDPNMAQRSFAYSGC